MDDGGINNGELVIHVVAYMIMIRSYIPEFSRRCTSCRWCIRNKMAGSTPKIQWHSPMVSGRIVFTFGQISDFCDNFTLFLNFYSFSNGQKVRKPRSATFTSITMCKSRFFPTKKKQKKQILGAKTRFCDNSHIFQKFQFLLLLSSTSGGDRYVRSLTFLYRIQSSTIFIWSIFWYGR